MTLPTESGEDTPLESLSMSSVSGLNSSKDISRGTERVDGVSVVTERLTRGNCLPAHNMTSKQHCSFINSQ